MADRFHRSLVACLLLLLASTAFATYKNWAAFDTLTEASEVVQKKVWGSLAKSDVAAIDREKLREVLGGEVVQELVLK